jgi:hypothetical protein
MMPQHDRVLPHVAEPNRMTEAEARVCGAASNRLANLRQLLTNPQKGCTMSVNGAAITLPEIDTRAVLALLIERESALLLGFNIQLDKPPA